MTFKQQLRQAEIVNLPEPGAGCASQVAEPALFDQVSVTATYTFRPLASDADPDLMALWLSEDADIQAAVLIEFTVDGVTYSRDRYGHWEQVDA